MSDLYKTPGQDMEQKATDELGRLQGHGGPLTCLGIVLPAEGHVAIFKSDQTLVGDGHAMGIARQVFQDLVRSSKGFFGIDHPLAAPERAFLTASHRLRHTSYF